MQYNQHGSIGNYSRLHKNILQPNQIHSIKTKLTTHLKILNEDNTYNTVEYIERGLKVHGHTQSVHDTVIDVERRQYLQHSRIC